MDDDMDLTKIEAARRQIDAATRMLFNSEDPFAIHTLAAAGFRILRDLADQRGSHINSLLKMNIAPGKERQFWAEFNCAANFLKHADKDADGIYRDFKEEWNDGLLFLGALYYQSLGHAMTPEMLTVGTFFSLNHPEFVRETANIQFQTLIRTQEWFRKVGRREQLSFARGVLALQLSGAG